MVSRLVSMSLSGDVKGDDRRCYRCTEQLALGSVELVLVLRRSAQASCSPPTMPMRKKKILSISTAWTAGACNLRPATK